MNHLEKQIYQLLGTIMDPELNIDIVSLGLIYQVTTSPLQTEHGEYQQVHILMTLTTPGCPLVGVISEMILTTLSALPELEEDRITIELTFDPPWVPDMMTEEARAELGL